jgi:ribosomal protein S14
MAIYRCERCGTFGNNPDRLHLCVNGFGPFKQATPIPGVSK